MKCKCPRCTKEGQECSQDGAVIVDYSELSLYTEFMPNLTKVPCCLGCIDLDNRVLYRLYTEFMVPQLAREHPEAREKLIKWLDLPLITY